MKIWISSIKKKHYVQLVLEYSFLIHLYDTRKKIEHSQLRLIDLCRKRCFSYWAVIITMFIYVYKRIKK